MKNLLILVASIALTGCVAQEALVKDTPSGKAEATFPGVTMEQVRNEFVLACARTGGEVQSDTYSVTCGKRNDSMRGMFAQALIGNAYSQTPWEKIKFTFAPTGNGIFVTVSGWMEMTMGFGEVKRIPYDNNNFRNQAQRGLDEVASRLSAKASSSGEQAPAPSQNSTQPPCIACAKIGGK